MTSREIVRRAIEFDGPPRIPYSFFVPLQSDFFEVAMLRFVTGQSLVEEPKRDVGEVYYDEWGVGHRVTGRAWDHAFDHPLRDLRNLDDYHFPDVAAPERFSSMKPYVRRAKEAGKYVVGYDPIMGFERMRALLGFEELMMAPYAQPEGLETLLDRLVALSVAIIEQWVSIGGVDGFMTWEDWGLQSGLQMKLETFREFYKPRYEQIVQAAHENGMHYIWHNCGQIMDMIPDVIEIGVDVVQLDQPRLMGHQRLSEEFGGRICFWNTVDIQWSVEDDVTASDLRAEVADMVRAFDRFDGGFLARQYPSPKDIGLSDERHMVIYEAFLESGCAL